LHHLALVSSFFHIELNKVFGSNIIGESDSEELEINKDQLERNKEELEGNKEELEGNKEELEYNTRSLEAIRKSPSCCQNPMVTRRRKWLQRLGLRLISCGGQY
jgi:hypothetical protein